MTDAVVYRCVCIGKCHGIGEWPPGCKHAGAVRDALQVETGDKE